MEDNMILVTSASDMTLVINIPDIPLHRAWKKRGASYPFDRRILEQAFYEPSVEYLFREGLLTTTDKQFLKDVGLMDEDEVLQVVPLSDTFMLRMIKLMPLRDLKTELAKLSESQLEELGNFTIEHYKDLQMDKIDALSEATHKDLMKAIVNYKAAQED